MIRFVTYLAPSLPEELFARIAAHVGRQLGCEVTLACDTRASGPVDDDPFARGEADVGFLCAPPFLALRGREPPSVELLGAGLSFDDPRCQGAPLDRLGLRGCVPVDESLYASERAALAETPAPAETLALHA